MRTVAENEEVQASTKAGEVPPPEASPLADGGGTPAKPRSGFARQKIKIARLTEDYENLQNDRDTLLADYHKLEQEYRALESAFGEISQLNSELAAELRQAKQHQGPVRYGSHNLMGLP